MRPLIALSVLIFCAACADNPGSAVQRAAEARVAAQARTLPALPERCRIQRTGGIAAGDRLDLAALRLAADRAALNAQMRGCAAWYDTLRQSLSGNTSPG